MVLVLCICASTFPDGIDHFLNLGDCDWARNKTFIIIVNPNSLKASVVIKYIVINIGDGMNLN